MAATAVFETHRPRLLDLAYRMLGSVDEAQDVVQEAWLRWQRSDPSSLDNPSAWLTTVTTRLAIDALTSARARRETYVGPWLPDPLVAADEPDPGETVAGAETLTLGFLRLLETLSPVERAVFLLHDVFGVPFREVAATVGRSEVATRQVARRARDRIRSGRPRLDPAPAEARILADAFFAAVVDGDLDRLTTLLTDDAVYVSDGGASRRAARRPVVGSARVARLLVNMARRSLSPLDEVHTVTVNGQLGVYVRRDDAPLVLTVLGWRGTRVAELASLLEPAKLERFDRRWCGKGSV